jgi:tetratricopeptide (TPR) repeat protein
MARLGEKPSDLPGQLAELEQMLLAARDPEEAVRYRRRLLDLATSLGDTEAMQRHAQALLATNTDELSTFLALKSRATAERNWDALVALLSTRAELEESDTERATVYYELGRVYEHELRDINAAASAYQQALIFWPEHTNALEALSEIAYQRNDWLMARELYEQLADHKGSLPADAIAYRRGEVAEALGREQEALECYEEAALIYPGHREALSALARTAARIGDVQRAVDATQALLDLLPGDDVVAHIAARLQLADYHRRAGALPRAIEQYERVLAEEPKSLTAIAQLCELYADIGDGAGSARAVRSLIALTVSPERRANLFYQLGEIYRNRLNDLDLAADAYLKGIDLDPEHLPTMRRLIDYYWRIGDLRSLADITSDLERRGALLDECEELTLARAALGATAAERPDLGGRIARALGEAAPNALATVLLEVAERDGSGAVAVRAAEARALCAASGIDLEEVVAATMAAESPGRDSLVSNLRG